MREPHESYNFTENYEYFFSIENRPLYTPIIFHNQEKTGYLKYKEHFYSKGHKNYPYLINHFTNRGETGLEKFHIKNCKFLVSKGTIFRYEVDENTTVETIFPIVIFCFDEYTDWNSTKGYKIVIDNNQLNHPQCKALKPKILKIVDKYLTNHESDVIYTNDVKKFCFNKAQKLKFKSIKEQKEFLKNLVEQIN